MTRDLGIRRSWLEALLSVLPMVFFGAGGGLEPDVRGRSSTGWREGQAAAIEVRGGRARFRAPASDRHADVLVVIASLAEERGPFPVELAVRAGEGIDAPRLVELAAPAVPVALVSRTARPLPQSPRQPPAERLFHLLTGDQPAIPSSYTPTRARLRGVGRWVQLYVATEDLAATPDSAVRDAILAFDDLIAPAAWRRFGAPEDVDGDGRFTILFSSSLERIPHTQAALAGYTRPADFDPAATPPLGNLCDMIYLNPSTQGAFLRTVIAHEYMHAILASRRVRAAHPAEEGWLEEALAHLAEDDHHFSQQNLDYRLAAFLDQPEKSQIRVDDEFGSLLFRSPADRGAAYRFLGYCVDRHGPGIRQTLVESSLSGVANLESATGERFEDLIRKFALELFLRGRTLGAGGSVPEPSRWPTAWGPLAELDLMGPRTTRLTLGEKTIDRWTCVGTGLHYVLVDGSTSGSIEVEVKGPPEARLQVSAVPLGSCAGRLDLVLERLSASVGRQAVRVRVVERHGQPVRLQALAWQPVRPRSATRDLSGLGRMDMLGIVGSFGTSLVPGAGSVVSKPIELPDAGPMLVRLIGVDPSGHCITAWAELPAAAKPAPNQVRHDHSKGPARL